MSKVDIGTQQIDDELGLLDQERGLLTLKCLLNGAAAAVQCEVEAIHLRVGNRHPLQHPACDSGPDPLVELNLSVWEPELDIEFVLERDQVVEEGHETGVLFELSSWVQRHGVGLSVDLEH